MARSKAKSTKQALIEKSSSQVFAIVAVASVVVSMSLVVLNILWGTAQFNDRVHTELEKARDTLEANIENAGPLQESFERLEISGNLIPNQADDKENSAVVLDALPSRYDFPELAASIAALADLSSVELNSFQGEDQGDIAADTLPDPQPEDIDFAVEVTGSYEAITRFLTNLENSIRPISVVSIEMAGTDSDLKVDIIAKTSYQPAFDITLQTETIE